MTTIETKSPTDIAAELERLATAWCDHHGADPESYKLFRAYRNHHASILAALRAAGEVERMREALEFYAAPESYQRDIDPDSGCLESQPVIADDGDIARRALAGSET